MASFCSKCGFPQSGNSAFCPQCGGRVGAATPPAAQQFAPPPAAPGGGSGSGMKILVVVLAIFGVLGVAVVGGVWYVGHKVKQAVVRTANTYGVDLNNLPSSTTSSSARSVKVHKVCDLLTAQEVSQLIGEPIDHVGPIDQACGYFGPPGLSAKLDRDLQAGMAKQGQPGGTTTTGDITKMLQQMEDTTSGVQLQPGQEMPLLMIAVDPDGKAQMTAMTIAKGIFSGISKESEAKGGISVGKDIPGLGDRAVRMPKMGLNVLQGETLIRIMTAPFPDADAKSIAVARAALAKL